MASLSVISACTGIPSKKIALLERFGFEFYEDEFDIDKHHQKALDELSRDRMSPYVLAYALRCRAKGMEEEEYSDRFVNLAAIAKIRQLSFELAFHDIGAGQVHNDTLETATFWIDQASGAERDENAFERLARWCKKVLFVGPRHAVEYPYLATRLLFSVPYEDLPAYPKRVQRALNKVIHHGHLDGWCRREPRPDGSNRHVFFRGTFDL